MIRRGSIFSAFRMGLVASGRGLCVMDSRVLFRVTKSRFKNWEVLERRKYTDYNQNREVQVVGKIYFAFVRLKRPLGTWLLRRPVKVVQSSMNLDRLTSPSSASRSRGVTLSLHRRVRGCQG